MIIQLHKVLIKQILQSLTDHKLVLKASKCLFGQTQVAYLGHIVSRKGLEVNPKKVKAISKWLIPKLIKHLRWLLGLIRYYKKFVKGYATMMPPLSSLFSKEKFTWIKMTQISFQNLKEAMMIFFYSSFSRIYFTFHSRNRCIRHDCGSNFNAKHTSYCLLQ